MQDLKTLINNKWFDDFQRGLSSRFSANRMTYNYRYQKNQGLDSVIVFLSKNESSTSIELKENGDLDFHFTKDNQMVIKQFEDCVKDDFHKMLAHAFIYLKDGNFEYHKEWYSNLKIKN